MLVPDWIFIRYASHLSFPLNSNSYPQMKHKFYNDGNTAGLLVLFGRGFYTTLSPSKKDCFLHTPSSHEEGRYYTSSHEEGCYYTTWQQPTAHLTPVPFIHTRPEYIYNVPDRHKPAGE